MTVTVQAARKAAEAAGYYIREGSYQGGTDDRLGRWYVGREGEVFRPHGVGYRTQGEAWQAAADAAAEMAQWEAVEALLEGPGGEAGYAFAGDELLRQREGYAALVREVWEPSMDADSAAEAVRARLGGEG